MDNLTSDTEYLKNLPRKRMASGVVILNDKNQILLVKPTYKDHWSVPGGVIEKDESPRAAALREVKEEIGLDLKEVIFLCVDYMAPQDSGYSTKDENLQFIFFGGKLSEKEIKQIKLPPTELSEYNFFEKDETLKLVNPKLSKRLTPCFEAIETGKSVYLEGGR